MEETGLKVVWEKEVEIDDKESIDSIILSCNVKEVNHDVHWVKTKKFGKRRIGLKLIDCGADVSYDVFKRTIDGNNFKEAGIRETMTLIDYISELPEEVKLISATKDQKTRGFTKSVLTVFIYEKIAVRLSFLYRGDIPFRRRYFLVFTEKK